jgi:recombination protein RecT
MTEVTQNGKVPLKVIDLLQTKGIKARIERLLPENINFDRFLQIAINEIREKPKLLSCDPMSVIESIGQSARLGLDIGGVNAHAHLIPYGSKCQFQVGVKGLEYLAQKAGVGVIESGIVYENDGFELEYGLTKKLSHCPTFKDRGNPICAWAMAQVENEKVFTHMSIDEIEKIKTYSKSANTPDSPWIKSYDEMAKKTVKKRLCKSLPQHSNSSLLHEAIALDDQADAGIQNNSSLFADAELVDVTPQKPTEKADEILVRMSEMKSVN